jgi:hypothetical protein
VSEKKRGEEIMGRVGMWKICKEGRNHLQGLGYLELSEQISLVIVMEVVVHKILDETELDEKRHVNQRAKSG